MCFWKLFLSFHADSSSNFEWFLMYIFGRANFHENLNWSKLNSKPEKLKSAGQIIFTTIQISANSLHYRKHRKNFHRDPINELGLWRVCFLALQSIKKFCRIFKFLLLVCIKLSRYVLTLNSRWSAKQHEILLPGSHEKKANRSDVFADVYWAFDINCLVWFLCGD